MTVLQWLLLVPVAGGSLYSVACVAAMARMAARARAAAAPAEAPAFGDGGAGGWPPVSVLRPVYGISRDLVENLHSLCRQDYPDYQVVLSAQREDEPALPLLYDLQREVGADRITVVVDGTGTVPNGKARNLLVGFSGARHELLVVSDSDVVLRPDYLKTIVAPLADPQVGCASTFYKAGGSIRRWYEALEYLFLNADWVPNLVFAHMTGAQAFVLGASNAVRRSTLEAVGGWGDLGYYLLEDSEMGRRILARGQRIAIVPYFVDTLVDLRGPAHWFRHQLYWDRNTRAGNPWGFFGTLFIRAIPFALLFAAVRRFDGLGLAVLAAAVACRLATAWLFMRRGLGDRTGPRWLALLPLRDLAGLAASALAFAGPTVVRHRQRFVVGRGGRMVADERAA